MYELRSFVRNRITGRIGEVLSTYENGWVGVLYDGQERKDEHVNDLCLASVEDAEHLLFGEGITESYNRPHFHAI